MCVGHDATSVLADDVVSGIADKASGRALTRSGLARSRRMCRAGELCVESVRGGVGDEV